MWERNATRAQGAQGYLVTDAQQDTRRDYRSILDASGDPSLLDTLVMRLAKGGEIVLAGFYSEPLRFTFAPAFMREIRLLLVQIVEVGLHVLGVILDLGMKASFCVVNEVPVVLPLDEAFEGQGDEQADGDGGEVEDEVAYAVDGLVGWVNV